MIPHLYLKKLFETFKCFVNFTRPNFKIGQICLCIEKTNRERSDSVPRALRYEISRGSVVFGKLLLLRQENGCIRFFS